jgi:hypothetical protein
MSDSEWNGGLIITRSRVRITECLSGNCPDEVVVSTIGGQIGDIVQAVSGGASLPIGEELLLFLEIADGQGSYRPVGLSAGCFELTDSPIGPIAVNGCAAPSFGTRPIRASVAPVRHQLAEIRQVARISTPQLGEEPCQ